jgi:hypothetical protein
VRPDLKRCDCGAEMVWAVSRNGRPMPLTWPPARLADVPMLVGKFVLVHAVRNGDPLAITASHVVTSLPENTAVYESHFATCPRAEEYRRS